MARKSAPAALHHLTFADGVRSYTCTVAPLRRSDETTWWWFSASDDPNRYAPFIAARGDTEQSVRDRIIAYYEDHLARRAAPPVNRWRKPAPTAGANAASSPNGGDPVRSREDTVDAPTVPLG